MNLQGLIVELETPVQKTLRYGVTVTLTHLAYGMTLQVWRKEAPLQIYTTKGVMVDGEYVFCEDTEEYAYCSMDDLVLLLSAEPEINKPAGRFNTDDIKALYAAKLTPPQQPA